VGTLFNQQTLYCDWGYNVDCSPPETPDRGTNARNLLYDPDRLVHRVVANRELATIPKWGPSFKISFDLKINSFGSDPDYEEYPAEWNGYSSVLAFKGNGGLDCCSHGDRVPVINLRQDGDLVFSHSVGEDTSHEFRYNIAELNQWYNIVVEQGPSEEDKFQFRILIDGEQVHSVKNPEPKSFDNVKVFAGTPFLPAADAHYKNLVWEAWQHQGRNTTTTMWEMGDREKDDDEEPNIKVITVTDVDVDGDKDTDDDVKVVSKVEAVVSDEDGDGKPEIEKIKITNIVKKDEDKKDQDIIGDDNEDPNVSVLNIVKDNNGKTDVDLSITNTVKDKDDENKDQDEDQDKDQDIVSKNNSKEPAISVINLIKDDTDGKSDVDLEIENIIENRANDEDLSVDVN